MKTNYVICPKCKKKGFFRPLSEREIINNMIDGVLGRCKYCDYKEFNKPTLFSEIRKNVVLINGDRKLSFSQRNTELARYFENKIAELTGGKDGGK